MKANEADEVLVPVSVRVPEPVYAELKREAGRQRRSMNAQIVTVLEKALCGETEKAEVAVTTPA